MDSKIWPTILGISLAVWGTSIIIDPIYYSSQYRYTFDFTDIKWVFGGFLVILGICFVFTTLLKKK